MTNTEETCVVGILVGVGSGTSVKAFDVHIKGQDIYVNCSDCSITFHGSYHASGQQHTKSGRTYVEWTGGSTGGMEPMKFSRTPPARVATRELFFRIGWDVCKLQAVLPTLDIIPNMLVNAQDLDGNSILGFHVSVVGNQVKSGSSVLGFPIIASHRFGRTVCVEIEAFVVSEESS